MTSYRREIFTLSAHQKPTVGDTKTSAQNRDHMGWIKCDGRSLLKDDFYFLWKVIGYSFGGSGDNFNLPDAQGKVPGLKGEFTDSSSNNETFIFGSTIGEYEHILTLNEMPSHNHGVAAGLQSSYNNSTSLEYTGITDGGHTHTGQTNEFVDSPESENAAPAVVGSVTVSGANQRKLTFTTATGNASIVDPGHRHTLNSAGNDYKHNNIQPTIVLGNLFIYTGKPNYPAFNFPYKADTNIY